MPLGAKKNKLKEKSRTDEQNKHKVDQRRRTILNRAKNRSYHEKDVRDHIGYVELCSSLSYGLSRIGMCLKFIKFVVFFTWHQPG